MSLANYAHARELARSHREHKLHTLRNALVLVAMLMRALQFSFSPLEEGQFWKLVSVTRRKHSGFFETPRDHNMI